MPAGRGGQSNDLTLQRYGFDWPSRQLPVDFKSQLTVGGTVSDIEREPSINIQIWTTVVGGMIAIVSGAVTALLAFYLTQIGWFTNTDYQQRAAILQKRLDLIERTAQLSGKAPGIDDVWQTYLRGINSAVKRGVVPSPEPVLSEKLGEYNGQFRAVLELDALFWPQNACSACFTEGNGKGPSLLELPTREYESAAGGHG